MVRRSGLEIKIRRVLAQGSLRSGARCNTLDYAALLRFMHMALSGVFATTLFLRTLMVHDEVDLILPSEAVLPVLA